MVEHLVRRDQRNETHNVRQIVEYVIEKCAPDSYMKLRRHMQDLNAQVCSECSTDGRCLHHHPTDEEIPQIFADNQRAGQWQGTRLRRAHQAQEILLPDTMPTLNFDEGKEGGDDT